MADLSKNFWVPTIVNGIDCLSYIYISIWLGRLENVFLDQEYHPTNLLTYKPEEDPYSEDKKELEKEAPVVEALPQESGIVTVASAETSDLLVNTKLHAII